MGWEQVRRDYRAMAKPRAIEEVGDIYLIRPLGFLLVQLFRRTPLTPTMVSFLAVLAGWVAAGLYFASARRGGAPAFAALAALALLLHSALDSADGQLARLKRLFTPLGRIVDGFCDNLAFGAIYLAIVAAQHARAPEHTAAVALLAAAGAASHSVQASLVEYQRTLYLFVVHGKTDILESRPDELHARAPRGAFARLLEALHHSYYRQQRALLPSTARLERRLVALREADPAALAALGPRYERSHRRLLPWWALLASNSHKLGVAAAAFLPAVGDGLWGGLGIGWFLVYDLALNAVAAALVLVQARVDARFAATLPDGEPEPGR